MYNRLPKEQKLKVIRRIRSGEKIASVCKELGISRTVVYQWIKKYAKNKQQTRSKVTYLSQKRRIQWNRLPVQLENKIVKIALKNPTFSAKKISALVNVSPHGIWNVLKRNDLSTEEFRNIYLYKNGQSLIKSVQTNDKLTMIRRYEAGEKVSSICRDFKVSRVVFYRWLKRYEQVPLRQGFAEQAKREALGNLRPRGERHYRFVPEAPNLVLKIVLEHPEYSSEKISNALLAKTGKKILGNHGIYNLLNRLSLNTYQSRLAYVKSQGSFNIPGSSQSVKSWSAPVFGGIPSFSGFAQPSFIQKIITSRLFISIVFVISVSFFLSLVLSNLSFGQGLAGKIGILFSFISFFFGIFFFIYSIKYYLTIAIVLSFSRRQEEDKGDKGFKATGLKSDLSSVRLERHPFVSIHVATYNEKRVVERLLKAVSTFQYDNYEVVVVDDSNDDTTLIIADYINKNVDSKLIKRSEVDNNTLIQVELSAGLTLKHLHRSSRSGFKGGALKEALKVTNPKAEYVMVFDADFIPYPDTIVQFLKYFQSTVDTLDFQKASSYQPSASSSESFSQLNASKLDARRSNIAAIQGYQWHVLNKSENWITRGVRTEYSGSYVIERSGEEIYSGLKQISGSVYMIRKDVLSSIGWGTSITEDFELTLKLYEKGYKVIYTPYIQAPAEGVSTIKRLIRQRMRWAEGHSHNIRKMFVRLLFGHWNTQPAAVDDEGRFKINDLRFKNENTKQDHKSYFINHKSKQERTWTPSPLTLPEKLEFLYLSPYYLQAAFFIIGTLSWFIAEVIFKVRLPFWTEIWGWSLVFTNLLALPLLNMVGLFLEESDEKDYLGIFSFIALSYIVAPFQGYAAIKGFLAKEEGPWFRTPKTGRITDTFMPGRLYRFVKGILGRPTGAIVQSSKLKVKSWNANPYLSLVTASNTFSNFKIKRKTVRWVGNASMAILLIVTIFLTNFANTLQFSPSAYAAKPEVKTVGQSALESTNKDQLGMSVGEKEKKHPKNEETIIKNVLSKEITGYRSIAKKTKNGETVEFIFHQSPKVRIKLGHREIEFETNRIGGKSVNPKIAKIYQDKEVIYEEIIEGVDLKYTLNNGDLIAEEFIIKNAKAADSIKDTVEQTVQTVDIKVVSPGDPKTFGFYTEEGKEIFKLSSPFLKDAKNEISNNVSISMQKTSTGHKLTKTLGVSAKQWLQDTSRAYPIVLDPTVIVDGTITADSEVQFGGLQRKIAGITVGGAGGAGVKIDDAGDPGAMSGAGRQVVRTSGGTLYSIINDSGSCEIWKSSDGTSWDEQDTADNPACGSGSPVAAGIDSSGIMHIAYLPTANGVVDYNTFNTSTDQFGTADTSLTLSGIDYLDIAIDSGDKPHIAATRRLTNSFVNYNNKVDGSWLAGASAVQLETVAGLDGFWNVSIAISEDNIPEISYTDAATNDLTAAVGNQNDATSFTLQDVDTSVNDTTDEKGNSIAVDSSGNTWIAYTDDTGVNQITLVKHNDADAWTTWQTPVTNSNVGNEPSIAIDGTDVYVFYEDSADDDIKYDRYTGSWLGETSLQTGTYQDAHVKWAFNNNNQGSTQIDYLFSDATDVYWSKLTLVSASTSFYAFYTDGADVFYKKSTDGGSTWGSAVDVDDTDADNYNPSIAVSNGYIFVFWADESADEIEGRRLDTSTDTLNTLCVSLTTLTGSTMSSFITTVSKFDDTSVLVAYSDTAADTDVDVAKVTGLSGACTVTDVHPGNVVFGSQGAGLTAGDRPVLVGLTSTTAAVVFQDGQLSYSYYDDSLTEWQRNDQTIVADTDTVYSVTTNGTTIWVLMQNGTASADLFSLNTSSSDVVETQIDADAGGADDDGDSDIDMFCPTEDNCKIVYTDNIDDGVAGEEPKLMFVDCNNADCTAPTVTTLIADIGDATDQAGASIFCVDDGDAVVSDNCKVVTADLLGGNTTDVSFIDCTNDEDCSTNTLTDVVTDIASAADTVLFHSSIYCPTDGNCKFVFTDELGIDVSFVDCADNICTLSTAVITDIDTDYGAGAVATAPWVDLYCVASDNCKIVYHDNDVTGGCADANSLCFVDCGASDDTGDEDCSTNTQTVIDSDIGTTQGASPVSINCVGGNTECSVVYGDGTDGDLFFVDCETNVCNSTNRTITQIDATGGATTGTFFKVSLDCVALDDCKFMYAGDTTSTAEDAYFGDCDNETCTAGSVFDLAGPRFGGAVECLTTANCKLVYYDGTSAAAPSVQFADCDTADCLVAWTDASDPWSGETTLETVAITYDSTNSDLYAHSIQDGTNQAYWKLSDAASISWGSETSYGFTAGDLAEISAPEKAAGTSQVGVVLRRAAANNYEFAPLPEYNIVLLAILPFMPKILRRLRGKKQILIARNR